MSSDQQDTNPYASPQAELTLPDSSSEGDPAAKPKLLRWRLIPTVLLVIFSGTWLLGSFGMIVEALVHLIRNGTTEPLNGPGVLYELLCAVGVGFVGTVWAYSALACWRCRWWRAVLTTIFGYAFAAGYSVWVDNMFGR